ncbi:hypothetical protein LF1_53670 [Rubripirellula obstinata]|uniref:Uncharacterized protein n=1 Tax=Rubripirellula obstinata TaxID=406547 RepID=A0A5B1C7X9_9BACT|nr:hypothetical protein LF1_53670 [Rubripirellula obstinata]
MHAPECRWQTFPFACTSIAATSVMLAVIRLGRGHLLPASRPAGHNPCSTKTALPPTLDLYRSADCPAEHQPTPKFQCSISAEVPDALRGTNQRLYSSTRFAAPRRNLFDQRNFATISTR